MPCSGAAHTHGCGAHPRRGHGRRSSRPPCPATHPPTPAGACCCPGRCLQELAKLYTCDRKGEEDPGDLPYWEFPVLSWHKGYLTFFYNPRMIREAQASGRRVRMEAGGWAPPPLPPWHSLPAPQRPHLHSCAAALP